MYKHGSKNIKVRNRGLTAVMAIKAIETMVSPRYPSPELPRSPVQQQQPPPSPLHPLSRHKHSFSFPSTVVADGDFGISSKDEKMETAAIATTTIPAATVVATDGGRKKRHSRCGSMRFSFQWLRRPLEGF